MDEDLQDIQTAPNPADTGEVLVMFFLELSSLVHAGCSGVGIM